MRLKSDSGTHCGAPLRRPEARFCQGSSVGIHCCSRAVAPVASIQLGRLQLDAFRVATLGRDSGNDVRLDHPSVSRFPAEVRRTSKGDILTDHSSNGVFVNGICVHDQHLLKNGDVLLAGAFGGLAAVVQKRKDVV